jgi:hypothetical protein
LRVLRVLNGVMAALWSGLLFLTLLFRPHASQGTRIFYALFAAVWTIMFLVLTHFALSDALRAGGA